MIYFVEPEDLTEDYVPLEAQKTDSIQRQQGRH